MPINEYIFGCHHVWPLFYGVALKNNFSENGINLNELVCDKVSKCATGGLGVVSS